MATLMKKPRVFPELLSVKQTAVYLGISESTVRTMLKNKELPKLTVGGCLRIRKADIKAMIHRRLAENGYAAD